MYSSRAYTSIARSYVRHFAGRNRRMRRSNNNKRGAKASATTIADDAPLLSHTLRKLYFLVHPDRTAMHPEVSERNTESMSELTGFLDDITSAERTASTQTNRKMRRLDFYVPAEEPAVEDAATTAAPQFRKVRLNLRDSGGDCRNAIRKQLSAFFGALNLRPDFIYDEKFTFNTGDGDRPQPRKKDDDDDDEIGKASRAANEESVVAETHNAVLQAIAALPWLEPSHKVRNYVETIGFDELAGQGLQLQSVARRIWRGERDVASLSRGLSASGRSCIERVLEHTATLEATSGPPKFGPEG